MLLGIVDIGSNAIKYKIFNTKDNSLVEYYREPLRLVKDAVSYTNLTLPTNISV